MFFVVLKGHGFNRAATHPQVFRNQPARRSRVQIPFQAPIPTCQRASANLLTRYRRESGVLTRCFIPIPFNAHANAAASSIINGMSSWATVALNFAKGKEATTAFSRTYPTNLCRETKASYSGSRSARLSRSLAILPSILATRASSSSFASWRVVRIENMQSNEITKSIAIEPNRKDLTCIIREPTASTAFC